MNTLKKYIIAAILPLFMVACGDDLELNPQQDLSTQLAFADGNTATGALIGIYSRAQDFDVFGSAPQTIADYHSDNVEFVGSFPTFQEVYQFSIITSNSSLSTIWRDHYRLILDANAVIANVPNVEDVSFSNEAKTQIVAEAKFLRAMTYFQLVNLFAQPIQVGGESGPGVPLVLDPFVGAVDFPARATVGEVHTAIASDLNDAVNALPETNDVGRATRGAAQALLSRVHLYRGEWQQAADLANQLINGSTYALASNYNFYSANTPEEIFSLQNTAIDNGATGSGGWASYYRPAEEGARGDCQISQYLIEAYIEEAGDLRFTELVDQGSNNAFFSRKFIDPVNNTDNVPLIRMTEMYLNRAEALAELSGVNNESIELMNLLRTRAGLSAWSASDFTSAGAFLDAIANERRKELAFEGHRRMDLLRRNQPLRPSNDPFFSLSQPGETQTIMPIPQREIDINTSLTQNPGY